MNQLQINLAFVTGCVLIGAFLLWRYRSLQHGRSFDEALRGPPTILYPIVGYGAIAMATVTAVITFVFHK